MKPSLELNFEEFHAGKAVSILCLHGALGSPLDFDLIVPGLTKYHLIIPSLHINSKGNIQFSIEKICAALATIISIHAQGACAHVFGFSMGGHVALHLAQNYPGVVVSCIASGVSICGQMPSWKQGCLPYVLYAQSILPARILSKQMLSSFIGKSLQIRSKPFCDKLASKPTTGDMALCNEIAKEMSGSLLSHFEDVQIKVKTLLIAGTASAMGKFPDSKVDTQRILAKLQSSYPQSCGIQIPAGSHPWIFQFPELCSTVVASWIEQISMPLGTLPLDS